MKKTAVLFLLVSCVSLFAQKYPSKWEVVDLIDDFNEETGEKRVVCQTKGTYTDSDILDGSLDVSVFIDGPALVSVIVYEKGTHRVSLENALFNYKTDSEKIEQAKLDGGLGDETKSFLYLLKQGGIIMVSAHLNNVSYRFDIDAGPFTGLFSEAFMHAASSLKFSFETSDMLGETITIECTVRYIWTPENERTLKEDGGVQYLANVFFSDKDKNGKDRENWGELLLEQIRLLYPDHDMEFLSFGAR